ncbi:ABC transporter permease subunit [Actinomadura sp. NEAU-AAG7]|uniref:ABC transporter permease subunit n=1 Tax=Actinomadura sp. NEAU-AAG7 TaxID=2839640 RepID=UPI0027E1F07F|nr:ABC transporter permease subunit [Actinomadura sp. NEAU-AAG7]
MTRDRYGFLLLLHAEWTKFRTVRGWVTGTVAAALLVVLFAVLAGIGGGGDGGPDVPVGPDGGPVTDSFYLVHRPLTGDGSVTAAVSAPRSSLPRGLADLRPGRVPWSKAGLIIKAGTRQGSPYAAIMLTGGHGVRMQDGYTRDTPGPAGAAPRWLRLDRSGEEVTGLASADGTHWTRVGTVRVRGLGTTVLGGPFVASPPAVRGMGTSGSVSTAVFEDLHAEGGWADGKWRGEQVGPRSPTFSGYPRNVAGSVAEEGGRLTVTGAGDIAPAVRASLPTGGTLGEILTGAFAALVAVVVIGTQFITSEYRGSLIHLTLAAAPRRGRVLAAKAIVLWTVTFAAGFVGAAVAVPVGGRLARASGVYVFPVAFATELRVVAGIAALLATASVLALAVGAVLRHGAGAVTAVVAGIVLPYVLVAIPFMPAGVSNWAARVTPAAAFAVQQTLVPYDQVASVYTPYEGYYPLPPWAGLGVLAGYAAAALAVAAVLLHRRDA